MRSQTFILLLSFPLFGLARTNSSSGFQTSTKSWGRPYPNITFAPADSFPSTASPESAILTESASGTSNSSRAATPSGSFSASHWTQSVDVSSTLSFSLSHSDLSSKVTTSFGNTTASFKTEDGPLDTNTALAITDDSSEANASQTTSMSSNSAVSTDGSINHTTVVLATTTDAAGSLDTVSEDFLATTYSDYAVSISNTVTISTSVTDSSGDVTAIPVVIGSGGIGYSVNSDSSGSVIAPPLVLPDLDGGAGSESSSIPSTDSSSNDDDGDSSDSDLSSDSSDTSDSGSDSDASTDSGSPNDPDESDDSNIEDNETYAESLCTSTNTKRDLNLFKREELLVASNVLKVALGLFGADKKGNSYAISAIDSASDLLTNKFPQEDQNEWVTGLGGRWTAPTKMKIRGQIYDRGTQIPWRFRWDYDPIKGPHINFELVKKGQTVKVAVQLDKSQWVDGDSDGKLTLDGIMDNMNIQAGGYSRANKGEDDFEKIKWPPGGPDAVKSNIKEYFKSEAAASC